MWVMYCSTLQHTATHCNTLQHTATHFNTLQHTATHCNTRTVLWCVGKRIWRHAFYRMAKPHKTLTRTSLCHIHMCHDSFHTTIIWDMTHSYVTRGIACHLTVQMQLCTDSLCNTTWMSHVTRGWVMSRVNEPCHVWMNESRKNVASVRMWHPTSNLQYEYSCVRIPIATHALHSRYTYPPEHLHRVCGDMTHSHMLTHADSSELIQMCHASRSHYRSTCIECVETWFYRNMTHSDILTHWDVPCVAHPKSLSHYTTEAPAQSVKKRNSFRCSIIRLSVP